MVDREYRVFWPYVKSLRFQETLLWKAAIAPGRTLPGCEVVGKSMLNLVSRFFKLPTCTQATVTIHAHAQGSTALLFLVLIA